MEAASVNKLKTFLKSFLSLNNTGVSLDYSDFYFVSKLICESVKVVEIVGLSKAGSKTGLYLTSPVLLLKMHFI